VAILILLAFNAMIRWVALPVLPLQSGNDWTWHLAALEGQLYDLVGLLSPYIAVLLLVWWAVRYLARFGGSMIESSDKLSSHLFRWVRRQAKVAGDDRKDASVFSRHSYAFVFLAVVLSVFASAYAYLPSLNPAGTSVSVDVVYYKQWLASLDASGSPAQAIVNSFTQVSGGDRPLSLLLMYAIGDIGIPNVYVVQYLPLLLAPLSVLVVFYSVRSITEDTELSSIAAFVTPFSSLVMVGIYTGFFADWLALIASFAFMAFFIRVCRTPSISNAFMAVTFSIAILLFHEYTWPPVAAAALLYALYAYLRRRKAPGGKGWPGLVTPVFVLAATSALDIVRSFIFRLSGAFATEANTVLTGFGTSATPGIQQFVNRWANLDFTFHYLSAGFLSDAPLLLAVLLMVLVVGARTELATFVLSMVVVASIPVLVGTPFIQLRAFYNLPLQLLFAYALLFLLHAEGRNQALARMTAILLILSQLANLFGSLWAIIP